jgi:hypothetical protein
MSVRGELNRTLGSCIDYLSASESEAAQRWVTALHSARAIVVADLSEAASQILALDDRSPSVEAIEFAMASERDEFRELYDHMLAIARVVLGRPAAGGSGA